MVEFFISGVAISTPGLSNWQEATQVLTQKVDFTPTPLEKYKPLLLPANERRRATQMTRLCFKVAEEVTETVAQERKNLATVFASSGGDYQVVDQICRSLRETDRMVSPTQFHNSVHNSAAGYWSIATGSQLPYTSISSFDFTFVAGLIEAGSTLALDGGDLLLVVYDMAPPEPILQKRPIYNDCALALLLSQKQTPSSIAKVKGELTAREEETRLHDEALESLRMTNPAARSLTLLRQIALKKEAEVIFNASETRSLRVQYLPI